MRWLINVALACGCFGIMVGTGAGVVHWMGYRINLTNSLPRGLYQETNELVYRGTFVVECLPVELAIVGWERGWFGSGYCPTKSPPILKQVTALAGDTVELTDEYVAVNGMIIPHSVTQKRDSQGRSVPAIPRGTYTLKAGEIWLLATNIPNSWDSRYTGPARVEDIIATARPVWTEGKYER